MVGAWAIFGLVAVYLLGARVFGRTAAAAAVGLLAINVAEVWFAKYPNSEVVMQALIFAALLAFTHALDGAPRFFGMVAGILLGGMLFLRYEVVLAMAAFAAAATLAPVTKQRVGYAFGVGLAVTSAIGLWYLAIPLRAYSAYPLGYTRDRGGWWLVGAGMLSAWVARRLLRREPFSRFVRNAIPVSLAAGLIVLAVYAYFFRQEGGRTALGDALAFRSFGWYFTPFVLGIAVAGVGILTPRRFWRSPAFFLTFAILSVFFFYKTRIVPEHFWTARRFLAVTLPGALLFVTALADDLVGPTRLAQLRKFSSFHGARQTASTWASAVGVVFVLAAISPIALTFWRASAPVRQHVEYAGLIPQLEQLASKVGDRDLLLVEARNAGSDLHVLALPLAYVYARHVLVLDSAVPSKRTLENFVSWARSRYDNVLFLGGGGTDLLTRRVGVEPVASTRFTVPEYDSPINAYPSGIRRKDFEFGLYRLVPAPHVRSGPFDLTIGDLDDVNVVRFHAKEKHSSTGTLFRWSRATSYILLLGVAEDARRLTIWMSNGGRPQTAPPAAVHLTLDDQDLGTTTPDEVIRPYTFAISPEAARRAAAVQDPVRLRLQVPTWNPAELLGVNDTRDLGVMVTRVEVQ
jgi:hypothetical protein